MREDSLSLLDNRALHRSEDAHEASLLGGDRLFDFPGIDEVTRRRQR